MRIISPFCVALLISNATFAVAQSLDQEITGLAGKISKTLAAQGFKSVAAIDFTDLQGRPTELGRFLADELSVEIVSQSGVSMVDRANIKSILSEHQLTETGLVNPANAKKLGEFAGVDVLLTGTVTALDASIVLTVKAVATETSRLVAAGRITFAKTSEIQQLLTRSVSPTADASAKSSKPVSGPRYQDASAIATKDLGALRVTLRSVLPFTTGVDSRGVSRSGLKCTFEFVNLDTQDSLWVAFNAEHLSTNMGPEQPIRLRTSLLDDEGRAWIAAGIRGLSVVRAGVYGRSGEKSYNATDIVKLLELRDNLGRADNDPNDRFPVIYGNGWELNRGNQFMTGSTTVIGPAASVNVTVDFVLAAEGEHVIPKAVQLSSEVVAGKGNTKRNYMLNTVMLDRIAVSKL